MSRVALLILFGGSAAALSVGQRWVQPPGDPGRDLRLTARLAGEVPDWPGFRAPAVLELHNTSRTRAYPVVHPGYWYRWDVRATLTDGNGREIPLERSPYFDCGSGAPHWSDYVLWLAPGGRVTCSLFGHAWTAFDVSRSGTLRITVRYQYDGSGRRLPRYGRPDPMRGAKPFELASNPVEFPVVVPFEIRVSPKSWPVVARKTVSFADVLNVRLVNTTTQEFRFTESPDRASANLKIEYGYGQEYTGQFVVDDESTTVMPPGGSVPPSGSLSVTPSARIYTGFKGPFRVRAAVWYPIGEYGTGRVVSEWVEIPVNPE